jgi:hypothetical protein
MFDKIIHNKCEPIVEVYKFDPKKDKIAFFFGTEEDIPSQDVIYKMSKSLEEFSNGESNLLVASAIVHIIILKGD